MRKFFTFSAVGLLVLLIIAGTAAFTWANVDAAQTDQPDGVTGERPTVPIREIVDPEVIKAAVADALGLTVEELEEAREAGMTIPEVAEEQGVEMDDVRTAAEAARVEMVQDAVDEGLITEEEAEWMLNHRGPRGRHGFGRHGPCCRFLREVIDADMMKAAVAGALGLSVDELEAAREAGKTIAEVAEEQGVEMDDVRAAAESAKEEMVQDAVDEDLITEEQAERILSHKGFPCRRGRRFPAGDAPPTVPNPDA